MVHQPFNLADAMTDNEPSPLTGEQRRALLVLGSLFLRMGQFRRAQKLFAALIALNPDDGQARRSLAAALLGLGDGDGALEHMEKIVGAAPLSSRDAVLYLLKARALWLTGRAEEAQNALNAWLAAGGGRS